MLFGIGVFKKKNKFTFFIYLPFHNYILVLRLMGNSFLKDIGLVLPL
jgi:hypothetical protein